MSSNWCGWEVWRFIKAFDEGVGGGGGGEYFIASLTKADKFLCSNSSGRVYTHARRTGPGRTWRIRKNVFGTGVVIESVSHKRQLVFDGWSLRTKSLNDVDLESESLTWHLEAANLGKFYLSNLGRRDRQLSRNRRGELVTSTNRRSGEEWWIEQQQQQHAGDGYFIRSRKSPSEDGCCFLTRCSEDPNNPVLEQQRGSSSWEIVLSPHYGGVLILNDDGGGGGGRRMLSCNDDDEVVCETDRYEKNESWILEPCMPPCSFSQTQVLTMVGAGIAVGAVMPFAVVGAVNLAGFTSAGISAGSYAAGMMSAEAGMSGGGVVAGGTVATLQSIGATGCLGAVGTGSAVFGGALVGSTGAKVLTRSARVGAKVCEEEVVQEHYQALAAWRSW